MKLYEITVKGNDGFEATVKIEAREIGKAVADALAWLNPLTIEQIIEVKAIFVENII